MIKCVFKSGKKSLKITGHPLVTQLTGEVALANLSKFNKITEYITNITFNILI